MNYETIGFLPTIELAEMIRTKKLSPVEYMRALLDRITARDPKVSAFVYLAADQALEGAKASLNNCRVSLMGLGCWCSST
jgi:aspartyl-tRNA(Asn)/glutamyl-tRNA(Gln) amidotransferase subunit A